MYSTIQAALDAQQDGEVVEVLDRGPYRESLTWRRKTDAGLISHVGTLIEAEEWTINRNNSSERLLHRFENLQGCRLQGFLFLYNQQDKNDHFVLLAYNTSGLCLEDLVFMDASSTGPLSEPGIFLMAKGKEWGATSLHGCVFDTALYASAQDHSADYLITRNWWIRSKPFPESPFLLRAAPTTSWIVSENVFDVPGLSHLFFVQEGHDQIGNCLHTYTRNTILQPAAELLVCSEGIPGRDVTITYNLWPLAGPIARVPSPLSSDARSFWTIQGNFGGTPGDTSPKIWQIPLANADHRGKITFLSLEPLNHNYARLDPQWVKEHFPDMQTVPGAVPSRSAPEARDWMDWLSTEYRLGRAAAHAAVQRRKAAR